MMFSVGKNRFVVGSARPALVTTVHGLNSVSAYSRVMTRGDRVIVVSIMARDHVLKHYPSLDPEIVRVIPRGADPGEFPPGHKASDQWRAQFRRLQGIRLDDRQAVRQRALFDRAGHELHAAAGRAVGLGQHQ